MAFDEKLAGWGKRHKLIWAEPLELDLAAARAGDVGAASRARRTLDAALSLLEDAFANGATLRESCRVDEILDRAVRCDAEIIEANVIVNAAGCEAARLTPALPIVPRKGHLAITDRYPRFCRHQLVELGYLTSAHVMTSESVAFNVQPRFTGQVLIGSSRELAGWDSSTNRRVLRRMLHRALHFMPALSELSEKLGVKVEGPHIGDKVFLDNLPERGAAFGIHGARVVTPDRWLKDGDEVVVGGLKFSVNEAPGHSPGSVVLFNADNKFALMGDVLFQNSVGRTDLPGGSHETLLKSIREKILPLGDDVTFLPGHGAASRIGIERLNNPFLRVN